MMVKDPGAVMRSYSLWSMIAGLLMLLQQIVPFWEDVVSDQTFMILGALAMTAGVIGRFIDQGIASQQNTDDTG